MQERVASLIDEVIRPLVEADGGGIELVRVEGDTVVVRLHGACGGCPGAPYTRSGVIEPVLRRGLGREIHVRVERSPGKASDPQGENEALVG